MCFAPQWCALFRHLNFQKVVRGWCVLYILTWKCASCHNGVQFFITHLASWLCTRRFSEPTFRPSGATNQWKNAAFRDFPTFSRICIFFLLTLSLLLFFLLIFLFSLPLPCPAFHLSILSEVWLLNFLRQFIENESLELLKCLTPWPTKPCLQDLSAAPWSLSVFAFLTCCFFSPSFLFASALPFFPSDRVFAWSPEWVCQGDRAGMGWKRKDLMRWRWDVMMVMTRILKIVIIRTTFIMHLPLNRVTSCGLLRVLHFFTLRGKKTSLSVKLKWCPERWGLDLSGFFSMEKEEKMKFWGR